MKSLPVSNESGEVFRIIGINLNLKAFIIAWQLKRIHNPCTCDHCKNYHLN